MLKYKYEFLKFIPTDFRTYEQHYHEMALKGYIVDKIYDSFVRYRKEEPQTLYYCFDRTEAIDQLEGEHSKKNEDYKAFIEQSSWKHVCRFSNYHLFSNTRNDNPIHSDETFKYELIQGDSEINKSFLFGICIIVLLIGIQLTQFGYQILFSDYLLNLVYYYFYGVIYYGFIFFQEIKHAKDFKKALEKGELPRIRSIYEIKRDTYFYELRFIPLLLMFISLNLTFALIMTLIYCFFIVSVGRVALKSKNNYVINAIILVLLIVSILPASITIASFNTKEATPIESKDVFGTSIKSPNHFKHDQSFLGGSYNKVLEVVRDEQDELYFMNITYINGHFKFISDFVFNQMLKESNYQFMTYHNTDLAYISEEDGVLLVRKENKILRFDYDQSSLFNMDEIIKHCFQS